MSTAGVARMPVGAVVPSLVRWGVSPDADLVYRALVTIGPQPAGQLSRDLGIALEDVQDAMGHADPRTTRRYDRDRHNLDRDPAYALATAREKRAR